MDELLQLSITTNIDGAPFFEYIGEVTDLSQNNSILLKTAGTFLDKNIKVSMSPSLANGCQLQNVRISGQDSLTIDESTFDEEHNRYIVNATNLQVTGEFIAENPGWFNQGIATQNNIQALGIGTIPKAVLINVTESDAVEQTAIPLFSSSGYVSSNLSINGLTVPAGKQLQTLNLDGSINLLEGTGAITKLKENASLKLYGGKQLARGIQIDYKKVFVDGATQVTDNTGKLITGAIKINSGIFTSSQATFSDSSNSNGIPITNIAEGRISKTGWVVQSNEVEVCDTPSDNYITGIELVAGNRIDITVPNGVNSHNVAEKITFTLIVDEDNNVYVE